MKGPELPLIRRELLQQSHRWRTYALRCLVLLVLSIVFLVPLVVIKSRQNSVSMFAALGFGRELTQVVMMTLSSLLYALTPAMTCGAISSERTRQTLPLLLISRLTARSIILEKLASNLVPPLVFLVLSAPLLAVSYLFGGTSFTEVATGLLLLMLLAIHLVAVSLFWSTVMPGSLGAFWATYGTLLVASFGLEMVRGFAQTVSPGWVDGVDVLLSPIGLFSEPAEFRTMILFPPFHVYSLMTGALTEWQALRAAVPFNVMTVVFVVMAQLALQVSSVGSGSVVRRATSVRERLRSRLARWQQPIRVLQELVPVSPWQAVDDPFPELRRPLPGEESIAWREREKLGPLRRWFLGASFLFVWCYWWLGTGFHPLQAGTSAMFVVTYEVLGLLLVLSLSCQLFVMERERQTLDSLLTCPLTCGSILRQKLAGVHQAMFWVFLVCAVVGLIRVFGVRFDISATLLSEPRDYSGYWTSRDPVHLFSLVWFSKSCEYLLGFLGNVFIFMTIVKWTGLWFGLKTATRMKAMLGSLLSVLALCFVPMICMVLCLVALDSNPDEMPLFFFSSPMIVEGISQGDEFVAVYRRSWFPDSDLTVILLNFVVYGGLAAGLRRFVLSQLPALLQRRDTPH